MLPKVLNTVGVRKNIKILNPKHKTDRHTWSDQWTTGDAFFSEPSSKSESQTSKSSKSSDSNGTSICSNVQQKTERCRKQKPQSRFAQMLHEKAKTQCIKVANDDNDEGLNADPDRNALQDNTAMVLDQSSPVDDMPSSMPIIDSQSSPIRTPFPTIDSHSSPIRGRNQIKKKDTTNQMVSKSLATYLDESINFAEKNIRRSKNKKMNTSLRELALNKLKDKRTSRDEICHQELSRKAKPLVLEVEKIETGFGKSILHSIVLSDNNEEFAANSLILILLNPQIISGLDLSFKYKVIVFPKWSSRKIGSRIYLYNAFNIEFEKYEEKVMDSNNVDSDSESKYTVIWTKERKWCRSDGRRHI